MKVGSNANPLQQVQECWLQECYERFNECFLTAAADSNEKSLCSFYLDIQFLNVMCLLQSTKATISKNSVWKCKNKMDYCCIYIEEDKNMSALIMFFQKTLKKSNFIKKKPHPAFLILQQLFSDAGVNAESVWMIFKLILAQTSFCHLLLFGSHSHGEYNLSVKIMYHYHWVIMADHRRKSETFPTKESSSSTRAILSTLRLSW